MAVSDLKIAVARVLRKVLLQYYPWKKMPNPGLFSWCARRAPLAPLLYAFTLSRKHVRFFQIGANDGETGDSLRPFILSMNWSGVLVEPVDYVFKRLKKLYDGHPRIALENVAIAAEAGTRPFYYIEESKGLPAAYDQIGSFILETVQKCASWIPDFDDRLRTRDIECISFTQLLQRHRYDGLDCLYMDVEGYDYELLKTWDFSTVKPPLLVFEWKHLSSGDREACRAMLKSHGYLLKEHERDMLALLEADAQASPKLSQAWKMLPENP